MLHWGVENIVVLSKLWRAAQCSVYVLLIIWFQLLVEHPLLVHGYR
jgi:hypothetical protein